MYNIKDRENLCNRIVQEIIRVADAMKAEIDYITSQFNIEWELVDVKVWNVFGSRLLAG